MFTVWHGLFSLVLMFPMLRIEASPLSTVQGKFKYTFLKQKTGKFNFRSYALNLVKINVFFLQRFVVPGPICLARTISSANLSAKLATIVQWSRLIYRPNVPIRQELCANLSANRSRKVNANIPLSFNKHISGIVCACNYQMRALRHIRPLIDHCREHTPSYASDWTTATPYSMDFLSPILITFSM